VYDLRSHGAPIFQKSAKFDVPYRNIIWPLVSHPIQECLILSQGKEMRIVALSKYTELTQLDKINSVMEFTPAKQFPLQEHSLVMQIAAGTRADLSEPLFIVTANSDGTCYAYSANMDKVSTGVAVLAGLSRVSLPSSASSSNGESLLDFSDSYPMEKCIGRGESAIKHRAFVFV
jgi:hypothetical protein